MCLEGVWKIYIQTAAIRLQGMKSMCVGRCPHNAIELQSVHSVQCNGRLADKLAHAHVFQWNVTKRSPVQTDCLQLNTSFNHLRGV